MALRKRVALIPAGTVNRPALPMTPRFITVHETGNTSPGANAAMHLLFTHAGGGSEQVSFHWVVDDREAIQLLPHSENGWHAGDGFNGPGNRQSIAVETCVNDGGDWEQTQRNLAELVADLCRETGIPVASIVQHHRWSGKNCPERLRQDGWQRLLDRVAARLAPPPPQRRPLPPPEDAILEAAWQANQARLGNKQFKGVLGRPDWGGEAADDYPVLVCERGVLLVVNGRAIDVTARCIDDFVTFNEGASTLVRF